ncbi:DNA translocase FtsK [Hydrogenophaga palleronii]|uniref:DNA translocase FtsK n=1 Tax=Hydrogenophaga palleronii TaxID=65655 RepID=UPI0014726756|nr:DNA translocase FtsK [Hydrogenophaga palleronii]
MEIKKNTATVDLQKTSTYTAALQVVAREQQASISLIQRRLKLQYSVALKLVNRMVQEGVIADTAEDSGNRAIFWSDARFQAFFNQQCTQRSVE